METTVAVVTGASRGLGQALAEQLLQAGASVITLARGNNADLAGIAEKHGSRFPVVSAQTGIVRSTNKRDVRTGDTPQPMLIAPAPDDHQRKTELIESLYHRLYLFGPCQTGDDEEMLALASEDDLFLAGCAQGQSWRIHDLGILPIVFLDPLCRIARIGDQYIRTFRCLTVPQ